jgi:hypothetical protein
VSRLRVVHGICELSANVPQRAQPRTDCIMSCKTNPHSAV